VNETKACRDGNCSQGERPQTYLYTYFIAKRQYGGVDRWSRKGNNWKEELTISLQCDERIQATWEVLIVSKKHRIRISKIELS
jgi:hypothetical protein